MTIDQIRQAAKDFKFVAGLSMWKPVVTVDVSPMGGVVLLRVEIVIPNSEGFGDMQDLSTSMELKIDQLIEDDRTPEKFIVDFLRPFFLHEFFESILVRGERMFDPHDKDKYHPGAL